MAPIFQVRRNLSIWSEIANSIAALKETDKETQKLFSFIQLAAQDNFVLGTCRIFDRPTRRNATLCILNFFNVIQRDETLRLRKSWDFKHGIKKFAYPEELAQKIKTNPDQARQYFLDYYLSIYNSPRIQENLNQILYVRDKFVGHAELLQTGYNFNPSIVTELMDYAEELTSVFNELFKGELYIANPSDQSAFFIKQALNKFGIQ